MSTTAASGWRAVVLGSLLAAAITGAATAGQPAPDCSNTPSHLCVPRYVSLKSGKINARLGPGDDYRILWTYTSAGLPVQVIAETPEWRRVCDPHGGVAWINSGTTSGRRTVLRPRPQPLALRDRPDPHARVTAFMAGMALAELDKCKDGWCRISLSGSSGWVAQGEVWGADERRQCASKR